jgi:UV DNA damage endonuclease
VEPRRLAAAKNATALRIRELIAGIREALDRVITFLERHRILLYRITSNLIPFASHPVNRLEWWTELRSRSAR